MGRETHTHSLNRKNVFYYVCTCNYHLPEQGSYVWDPGEEVIWFLEDGTKHSSLLLYIVYIIDIHVIQELSCSPDSVFANVHYSFVLRSSVMF